MKQYIEFKLHKGEVPFFVDSTLSISDINGKYYGVSLDSEESYLPSTVVTLTQADLKQTLIDNAVITESVDDEAVVLDGDDKEAYIDSWIEEHPAEDPVV